MPKRSADYFPADSASCISAAWLAKIRAAVPPRPKLQLDPRRCALLVVDALRYFVSPEGRCFLPAAPAAVSNIALLLDAWHGDGGPVVFTRHCHAGPQDLGMLGRFFSDHIRCGEPDSELSPKLVPGPADLVLRKTTYDAFLGTGLEELLNERQVRQVLVTGVLTHMCCETTARAAFCRGFEVYFAPDATASSTEALHLGALLGLADSVAVMMSTPEILKLCKSSR